MKTERLKLQTDPWKTSMTPENYRLKVLNPSQANLNSTTTAVAVIDMQNDYCRKEGKFFTSESQSAVVPISALLAKARAKGIPIIYTRNCLADADGSWACAYQKGWSVTPPHCLAGTWGAEIVDELGPPKMTK